MITEITPTTSLATTITVPPPDGTQVSTSLAITAFATTLTILTLSTALYIHPLTTSLSIPTQTQGTISYWLWATTPDSRILWADGSGMRL